MSSKFQLAVLVRVKGDIDIVDGVANLYTGTNIEASAIFVIRSTDPLGCHPLMIVPPEQYGLQSWATSQRF